MRPSRLPPFHALGCIVLAASLSLAGTSISAFAADRFWTNNDTDFNDDANWDTVAPGTGDRGFFEAPVDGLVNPNLTASTTIVGLSFVNGATGYNLTGDAGTLLTLTSASYLANNEGAVTSAAMYFAGGNNSVSANIHFSSDNASIGMNLGAIATISGNISGNTLFVNEFTGRDDRFEFFNGGGTLTLSGDNSGLVGGINFTDSGAMRLNIASTTALGASSGTFRWASNGGSGGYLDNTSGGSMQLSTNQAIALEGNTGHRVTYVGSNDLHMGDGIVTLTNNRTIEVQGSRLTFGGGITDGDSTFSLIKYGAGTLELQGASSYEGTTTIQGGNSSSTIGGLLLTENGSVSEANLAIRGWGVLGLGNGDFSRALGSGAGQVQMDASGGTTGNGGFAAYGADRRVNLGGSGEMLTWGVTADWLGQGASLILGATDADAKVDFQNNMDLGEQTTGSGNRNLLVIDGTAAIDAEVSGVISGAASGKFINKTGNGTLEFTNSNTYTGNTNITEGRLLVNNTSGSGTGAGNVSVSAGAVLGGTGMILPGSGKRISVASSGTVQPGSNGIESLTIDGSETNLNVLSMAADALFEFDLDADAIGMQSDLIELINGQTNDISFGGNLINFDDHSLVEQTFTYTLFTSDVENAYAGLTLDGEVIIGGLSIGTGLENYESSQLRLVGNSILLDVVAIPEPGALSLALLAGGALFLTRRRRPAC